MIWKSCAGLFLGKIEAGALKLNIEVS